jgi:hypothetical protein
MSFGGAPAAGGSDLAEGGEDTLRDSPQPGIMRLWTLRIRTSKGWPERSPAYTEHGGSRSSSLPKNKHLPWSVSIDEGRGDDATTAHATTLVEALEVRLTK